MSEVFNLKNNQVFVLAEAAGGVYNSAQIRTIVEIAEAESAFVKISEDSRMGFMIDPDKITEVATLLQAQGLLLRHYQSSGTPTVRTCLGELCPHSEQNALDDCLDLSAKLTSHFSTPQPFVSVGMNGCARACMSSATDDVHIVAESTGYKISIGGKSRELPQLGQFLAENIQKEDLPELICGILDVYYTQAQEGERLCDVIERVGMSPFLELAEVSQSSLLSSDDFASLEGAAGDELQHLDGALDSEHNVTSPEDTVHADFEQLNVAVDGDEALLPIEGDFENFDSDLEETDLAGVSPESKDPEFEEISVDDVSFQDEQNEQQDHQKQQLHNTELESAEHSLLAEENIDLEDGTTEDLERVTRAIRSELDLEESAPMGESTMMDDVAPELPEVSEVREEEMDLDEPVHHTSKHLNNLQLPETDDDFDADVALMPQSSHSQASEESHEAQSHGGRFKVKIVGNQLCITLPSGIECRVPVSSIAEGSTYEMEFSDGVLVLEGQGEVLVLRYGPLCVSVPLHAERTAA